jgi:hypothetical protein
VVLAYGRFTGELPVVEVERFSISMTPIGT